MIGMGLYQCLRKIGIRQKGAGAICIGMILCYGMMTGMSMSSVRAIIMFAMHLLAAALGRTYDMATALALAAVLLLAEQPGYAFHSGFLFSFGAVASLGLLPGVLQEEEVCWKGTAMRKGRAIGVSGSPGKSNRRRFPAFP